MQIVTVKVADLKHCENNVRKHPENQVDEFVRSIEQFGQIRPFVVDEDNVVWVGNGMLEAMRKMGMEEADAYRATGLTDAQKKKLMLADNKLFRLGFDDMVNLEIIMGELDDFDIPGFDASVLEELYGADDEAALEDVMGYGTASAEHIEGIQAAAAKAEERVATAVELTPAPKAPEPTGAPDVVAVTTPAGETVEVKAVEYEKKENVAQFVLCPKCGEKIWL